MRFGAKIATRIIASDIFGVKTHILTLNHQKIYQKLWNYNNILIKHVTKWHLFEDWTLLIWLDNWDFNLHWLKITCHLLLLPQRTISYKTFLGQFWVPPSKIASTRIIASKLWWPRRRNYQGSTVCGLGHTQKERIFNKRKSHFCKSWKLG